MTRKPVVPGIVAERIRDALVEEFPRADEVSCELFFWSNRGQEPMEGYHAKVVLGNQKLDRRFVLVPHVIEHNVRVGWDRASHDLGQMCAREMRRVASRVPV